MNRKYAATLTLIAAAAFGLGVAAENTTKSPNVFFLKSHGKKIAELRREPGTTLEITAHDSDGQVEFTLETGAFSLTNGAKLKLISGTNSVTITADEIEGRVESK